MTSNITTEREFLFVIEIKNEELYKDHLALADFLRTLPQSSRIYAVIHAGLNLLKIYCATKIYRDVESIADQTGYVTHIVDSKNMLGSLN